MSDVRTQCRLCTAPLTKRRDTCAYCEANEKRPDLMGLDHGAWVVDRGIQRWVPAA